MTFQTFTSIVRPAAMALAIAAGAGLGMETRANSHCGGEYVIASGDTLGKVANRCGHSLAEILKVNTGINTNRIRIGQRITLPGARAKAASLDLHALESVSTKGRIVNGRWCALIKTADGQVYGLRSRKHIFTSGADVAIEGKLVDGECGQEKTILVGALEPLS